ncbi:hypothetical protein [Hyphomicrobium sp.]|uniref:hypothetical protein n=1 Tax=Hyphomicrobium sp. TaxID=82 RepID=UPI000F93F2FB|nr:hypothetical protein [Hyphomicrobium sp.]RUP09700.1 MAG: hypothetical protein EKK38_10225 [Hyphomicrobium sp.]
MSDGDATMVEVIDVRDTSSFLSWRGILAGAVAGTAFSFVLMSIGIAAGLSLLSPWPGQSHTWLAASVAAAWALIATIASFLIAGFVAARVRPRAADVPPDEVEYRDGLQGLVTWGVCVLFAALVAASAGSAALRGGASAIAKFSSTSSSPLSGVVSALAAPPEGKPVTNVQLLSPEEEKTIEAVFMRSFGNEHLSPNDKNLVSSIVAARAGIPQADAQARIDTAYTDAIAALDKAKKATELSGLLTGIGLLIGLAAAWYGGIRGGSSRDTSVPARFRFRAF